MTARWRGKRRHRRHVNKKYKAIKTTHTLKMPRNRKKITVWTFLGDPTRKRR